MKKWKEAEVLEYYDVDRVEVTRKMKRRVQRYRHCTSVSEVSHSLMNIIIIRQIAIL